MEAKLLNPSTSVQSKMVQPLLEVPIWLPVREYDVYSIVEKSKVVDTSVAIGSAHGIPFGVWQWIAAGTPLSFELASAIQATLLWGDFCLPPTLTEQFGKIDDLDFFTQGLKQTKDAGSQLKEAMEVFFNEVNDLLDGAGTWTITQTLIGQEGYKLFNSSIVDYGQTNEQTGVIGVTNVEFYEVIGVFDSQGASVSESRPGMERIWANTGLQAVGKGRKKAC